MRLEYIQRIFFIIILLIATTQAWAQTEDVKDPAPCCGFLLGAQEIGIGFGNIPVVKGIRFNFRDHGLKQVDGLNLSLWVPKENTGSVVNGFNLGLLPEAGTMNGISIGVLGATGNELNGVFAGLLGVGAVDDIKGLSIGGLGVASNKRLAGISIAGAAVAGRDDVRGISLSGIGIGSGGDISGVQIAGIGLGAGADMRGFNLAGIGLGAGGKLEGISIAGIGLGSGDDIRGLALSGIGIGASETITGVSVSGIGTGAKQLKGIHLSGIGMGAQKVEGIVVAGVGLGTESITGFAMTGVAMGAKELQGLFVSPVLVAKELRGISINPVVNSIYQNYGVTLATINSVRCPNDQRWGNSATENCEAINMGVQIGIYNYSRRMGARAWQIGLLNYVRENRKGMRLLPLVNRRFE